jgi:hypothetical protein
LPADSFSSLPHAALDRACEHQDGRVRTAVQEAWMTVRRGPIRWD